MYVQFISEKENKFLTKNKIYEVLQTKEDYYYLIKDDVNIETVYEPNLFKIVPILKVKYVGHSDNLSLIKNKIYDVISIESGFQKNDTYRIIDETDDDYLYHKDSFEIIETNFQINGFGQIIY
jgi:hypothetical protein